MNIIFFRFRIEISYNGRDRKALKKALGLKAYMIREKEELKTGRRVKNELFLQLTIRPP